MTEIYKIISELSSKFKTMCYGLTQNETDIEEAVQELMLYFLQMNPDSLKRIYEKDGKDGIIRYGAVVLKRALTSPRSPFYYKYKKYYTYLDENATNITYDITKSGEVSNTKHLLNIPNAEVNNYQWTKLEEIDSILDKKVYWYDKKVFQLYYYEGNTLDSLAKKTGISRNSLFSTIDKVRELIKEELDE